MKKVNVSLYPGAVKKLSDVQVKAARKTADQLRTDVVNAAVIPFDEGTLQNVQTYIDDSGLSKGVIKIAHDTPYALRLYYHPEYDFSTLHNANAQGQWWEPWLTGSKKSRPAQLFRMFMKKLL